MNFPNFLSISRFLALLIFVIPVIFSATAQRSLKSEPPIRSLNAAEIQEELRKVQVLGSVMYIAAHPDDENTRLIAYLTKGRGYHTTYMSLTRGDGGQNLIGTEKGPDLGVLRTQELLAARNIDGAHQMFSRAIDFGYSKNPEETLEIWDREKVLGDVVLAIRQLQPDVIITRFPGPEDGGGGHGHHTSSYILAREAFDLAADPKAYPEQLAGGMKPWQATRILWNNWKPYWQKNYDASGLLKLNIGEYNPMLGMSYSEIASLARSQHKCQAFGTYRQRGPRMEYLEHKAGDPVENDFMDGINTGWTRLEEGKRFEELLARAEKEFDPKNPTGILPYLLDAYRATMQVSYSGNWVNRKRAQIENLIIQCSGLWVEALTDAPTASPGDSLGITLNILNRSDYPVRCKSFDVLGLWNPNEPAIFSDAWNGEFIKNNDEPLTYEAKILVPAKAEISQPYWLEKSGEKGIYQVDKGYMIGNPENYDVLSAGFELIFGEKDPVRIYMNFPVTHKYVDRAVGEMYRPFAITPNVTVNLDEKVCLFADDKPREVSMRVRSHSDRPMKGTLRFDLPEGFKVSPTSIDLDFSKKGEEMPVKVTVTPSSKQTAGVLRAVVEVGTGRQAVPQTETRTFSNSFTEIEYSHIPTQLLFHPAETRVVRIDLKKKGEKIGYIMGSGDEIPASLGQVGYQVTLLEDNEITLENLRKFDAVVAGIRAYNRRERLPFVQDQILKYVEEGGTYIVQYNTTRGLKTDQPGPYPLTISRDRVAVEEAEIKMLNPKHTLFNSPNKITDKDFEGWVQERGLYFPNEWDDKYEALTECNDPGEDPKRGALLVANHGKGHYIYTGFSWFRELPAGVPGAYRIFANMLSIE